MKLNNTIKIGRPEDNNEQTFITYIWPNEEGNERLRMELVPHEKSTVSSMMSNITKRPALNLAKMIHKYTHATPEDMKSLFKDAGVIDRSLDEALDNVYEAFNLCAANGRPHLKNGYLSVTLTKNLIAKYRLIL